MDELTEIKTLLTELRDTQRESLTEYRKVTAESLELQRQAVLRQEQISRLSKRLIIFIMLVMIGVIILLIKLRIENYN